MRVEPDHHAQATAAGERLAGIYREVGERSMRELPVYNDALDVEAIGFRCHDGRALGVVLTPWFMNIVLAPLDEAAGDGSPAGATVQRALPAGNFDFTVGDLDGFGRIETCSLFSPMFAFAGQEAARAAAHAALAALLDPDFTDKADDAPIATRATAPARLNRRSLLRGELASRL